MLQHMLRLRLPAYLSDQFRVGRDLAINRETLPFPPTRARVKRVDCAWLPADVDSITLFTSQSTSPQRMP